MFFVEVAKPNVDSADHETHIIFESWWPPSAQYNCNSFGASTYSMQSTTKILGAVASGDGANLSAGDAVGLASPRGISAVEQPMIESDDNASADQMRIEPKELILG